MQVLREELHCKLPVEVAWMGEGEMPRATFVALQKHFGPLSGFDVRAVPYPRPFKK